MKDHIDLFVPGRLCIFGEHSDWASEYRVENDRIEKGYAIVAGIEQGIYASCRKSDQFVMIHGNRKFQCDLDLEKLEYLIYHDDYYSYVAGVFYYMLDHYSVGGIEITITSTDLPEKKGLSSSAAICVLVARSLNHLYHLGLPVSQEAKIAYHGERFRSKCGKLDQVCAYGQKALFLEFDQGEVHVKPLTIGRDLYFVFADLNSKKDTKEILDSLNSCFPYPKNQIEKNVVDTFGSFNKRMIDEVVEYFVQGNAKKIGDLMKKVQKQFDEACIPVCHELEAPKLHQILNDSIVKVCAYGGKSVGSGGDGSIQFIVKDESSQKRLLRYLEDAYSCTAYPLTLSRSADIKKAVVPLAGFGSRMYPFTKSIPKAFLPVIDHDILKPTFMVILEELYDAGIEEIALVIDRENEKIFQSFFQEYQRRDKLDSASYEYEKKIQKIARTITYIYQDEKLGLGHAISLCEEFIGNDYFLVALGDQICRSNTKESCLEQLVKEYQKRKKMVISGYLTPLDEVSKYGVLSGKLKNSKDRFFELNEIVEKPEVSDAVCYYFVKRGRKKEYYTMFGHYILPPKIFTFLKRNIKNKKLERNEYQLTSALEDVLKRYGGYAFIPDGVMYDVGNVTSYVTTLQNMN